MGEGEQSVGTVAGDDRVFFLEFAAGEVDEVMTWDRLRAAYGGKLALLPDTAFAARAG